MMTVSKKAVYKEALSSQIMYFPFKYIEQKENNKNIPPPLELLLGVEVEEAGTEVEKALP